MLDDTYDPEVLSYIVVPVTFVTHPVDKIALSMSAMCIMQLSTEAHLAASALTYLETAELIKLDAVDWFQPVAYVTLVLIVTV